MLEEYFHGEHRDKLHETRSAAKSVTATLVGAAMQAGAPLKLSTPVYEVMNGGAFPPDLEPRKRAMTLEHLLTMSSGYFCDDTNDDAPGNEETMSDQTDEPDFYRYTLKVPMAIAAGREGRLLQRQSEPRPRRPGARHRESPIYIFDRLIGGADEDRPLRLAARSGRQSVWRRRRAVPAARFHEVRPAHAQRRNVGGPPDSRAAISSRAPPRRSTTCATSATAISGGASTIPYKDRTVHAFYAGGAGGQIVIVVPELDLVIATYGGNYVTSKATHYISRDLTRDFILATVR